MKTRRKLEINWCYKAAYSGMVLLILLSGCGQSNSKSFTGPKPGSPEDMKIAAETNRIVADKSIPPAEKERQIKALREAYKSSQRQ